MIKTHQQQLVMITYDSCVCCVSSDGMQWMCSLQVIGLLLWQVWHNCQLMIACRIYVYLDYNYNAIRDDSKSRTFRIAVILPRIVEAIRMHRCFSRNLSIDMRKLWIGSWLINRRCIPNSWCRSYINMFEMKSHLLMYDDYPKIEHSWPRLFAKSSTIANNVYHNQHIHQTIYRMYNVFILTKIQWSVYIQMIRDGYIKTINDMNRDYEEDTAGDFA